MGNPENVSELPRPLPETIDANPANMAISPNALRELKQMTGRTLDELMGENATEEDRMQAAVWLELRRQGHKATWEQAGDVGFRAVEEPPDPTSAEPSTSSPGSAATGG